MNIRIRTVKNGFIVYPGEDVPTHSAMLDSEVMVFETFDGLVKFLKEYFGPLVSAEPLKVPDSLSAPINGMSITEKPTAIPRRKG